MVRWSHENNFDISFRVILLLPRETELCLVLMTNTWSVYRFQALKLNPIECLRFINCYGKANRETHPLTQ